MNKEKGMKAGLVGLFINALLFLIKLVVGTMSHSVSIVADAMNNLSDFLSSLLTYVGFKIGQRPADKNYPFGYERFEYISGFLISILMLYIGLDVFRTGMTAIFSPVKLAVESPMIWVMVISILLKLLLAFYYEQQFKATGSNVIKAARQDSLNDVLISMAILLGLFMSSRFNFYIDGYLGIGIAMVIIVTSLQMIWSFIQELVGKRPSQQKIDAIIEVLDYQSNIEGYHDLLIHEYGDETSFGSVHVEVDDRLSLNEAHAIIDKIEREILNATGMDIVAHLDPIDLTSKYTKMLYDKVKSVLKNLHPDLDFHDFRIMDGVVEFDVDVFEGCNLSDSEILEALKLALDEPMHVTFDHSSLLEKD